MINSDYIGRILGKAGLLFFFILLSSGLHGQGQSRVVALEDLLHELNQEVDLRVSYNVDFVREITVRRPPENLSRKEWIRYLEKETGIVFKKLRGRNYTLTVPPSNNQEELFKGQVIDSESQEPLPYAAISIVGTSLGAEADEQGNFSLSQVKTNDSVVVQLLGYKSLMLSVEELAAGGPIYLMAADLMLEDVLISQKAVAPIDYQEGEGYYRVRPDQLNLQNGWGEPDLLRSLQSLPGISTFDESAANLSIRGGTPDQNLVMIDGIPVYKFGHFFGMLSALNPYIIEDVKIHKGGFGANYGGRASSVIDIENKSEPPETLEGGVGINLLSLHAHLHVPMFRKRASLLFSARTSITDKLNTNVLDNIFGQVFQFGRISEYQEIEEVDLINKNSARFDYGEVNLKFNWKYKEDDEFFISMYNSADRFIYDFEVDQPFLTQITQDDLESANFGINIGASYRWSNIWQSKLSMVGSAYRSQQSAIYSGAVSDPYWVRAVIANDMENKHLRFDQIIDLSSGHTLTVGLEAQRFTIHFDTEFEEIWKEEIDRQDLELSNQVGTVYFNYDGTIAKRLFLTAGLRLNRINEISMNIWEPRLALQFRPSEGSPVMLKFQTGSYKQFVSTLILEEEDTGLGIGNNLWITTTLTDDLPVLLTEDVVAGISFQKNGWLLDLEGYLKYTEGLSVLNLQFDRPDDKAFSPGSADARGLEVLLQKKWTSYRSTLAYTLSRVDYTFPELNNGGLFPASQDQRHNLNSNHFYRWNRFEFILGLHMNSGKPYTKPQAINSRVRQDDGTLYYTLDNQIRNSERLKTYRRTDLSLQYQIIKPKFQFKTGITVFNLFNRENQLDRRYLLVYPDGQEEPEIAEAEELSMRRTVNVFVRVGF